MIVKDYEEQYSHSKKAKNKWSTYKYCQNDYGVEFKIGKKYLLANYPDEIKVESIGSNGDIYYYDWMKRLCYFNANEIKASDILSYDKKEYK